MSYDVKCVPSLFSSQVLYVLMGINPRARQSFIKFQSWSEKSWGTVPKTKSSYLSAIMLSKTCYEDTHTEEDKIMPKSSYLSSETLQYYSFFIRALKNECKTKTLTWHCSSYFYLERVPLYVPFSLPHPFLLILCHLSVPCILPHASACKKIIYLTQSLTIHWTKGPWLQYLGEAAGSAVLAPGGEVPELDVQKFDQLGHGPHCGWHIARSQKPFGLLCQLPGHNCCCLAWTELGAKQGDGVERGIKWKNERDGWKLKSQMRWERERKVWKRKES